ncbi:hypothetical protein [Streptomyces sp. NPDC002692]
MHCTLCTTTVEFDSICVACTITTREEIASLPGLWEQLEECLTPDVRGASPYGGRASKVEAPMPLDGEVLSLRAAGGIIGVLEDWHAAIRQTRSRPALQPSGSLGHRLTVAAAGLIDHIHFIALWEQGPVLAREIHRLVERVQDILDPGRADDQPRILGRCIAVDSSGVICGAEIVADMSRPVQCDWCLCPYPPSQWLQLRALQPGRAGAARVPAASAA